MCVKLKSNKIKLFHNYAITMYIGTKYGQIYVLNNMDRAEWADKAVHTSCRCCCCYNLFIKYKAF